MTAMPEVEGRLERLRAAMAAEGLAAVVLAGNTEFQQKGYIRYFAGWRLFGGTAYLVVPAAGAPVLVMGPGAQAEWAQELSAVPDTRAVPDKVAGVLAALGAVAAPGARIGVAGLQTIMPHGDATRLAAGLPEGALCDATDLVEALWAILSPAEAAAAEAAHGRVAGVFDAFRDALRPGRTEREVVADAIAVAVRAGCAEGVIHLTHDHRGGTRPASDRPVGREDIVKMFMEFLTPEGYLIELGGCFSFRPPPPAWQRKFDIVTGAIEDAIAATRPGMVADELVARIRRSFERAGAVVTGRRLWDFHGQGMHSLLRPFGLPGSTDPICAGMMINIHPGLLTDDGLGISATNNYLVTPGGGVALGGFRHRWQVVG